MRTCVDVKKRYVSGDLNIIMFETVISDMLFELNHRIFQAFDIFSSKIKIIQNFEKELIQVNQNCENWKKDGNLIFFSMFDSCFKTKTPNGRAQVSIKTCFSKKSGKVRVPSSFSLLNIS